jgi:hypothetical protein
MSSSPNRASHPAGKPRRKDVTLDLTTSRQMLPLVRGIVADITDTHRKLGELVAEQEVLDSNRRALTWVSRQRRYAVQDEITLAEKNLAGAAAELNALGLSLVDAEAGRVDFPTRINGRPAAFSWQLGEDALTFWHYAGEGQRRSIPADWQHGTPLRVRSES